MKPCCNACDAIDNYCELNPMGYCKRCHDLLQAAPDLLEAAKAAMQCYERAMGYDTTEARAGAICDMADYLRPAINKAEGVLK